MGSADTRWAVPPDDPGTAAFLAFWHQPVHRPVHPTKEHTMTTPTPVRRARSVAAAAALGVATLLPAVATVAGATTLHSGSTNPTGSSSGRSSVIEDAVGDDHASHAHGHQH